MSTQNNKPEIKFDISKVKKTSINNIRVNTWNPKEPDTSDYKKVLKMVNDLGLRDFIIVRTNPDNGIEYEVIDGQQRFTAAKELGYQEVMIYDEGKVDDKLAKELTIAYQQQVPFDKIKEAFFITEMVNEFGIEQLNLPYSELEIKDMADLASFDFSQYDQQSKPPENGDIRTIAIKVEKDKYDFIMNIIHQVSEAEDCNEGRALELICADYFSNGNITEE